MKCMRPAVNVGLSVSRVGGAAQTKAMKKSLRYDPYRPGPVPGNAGIYPVSSDLDAATKAQLAYGSTLMELLKQPLCHPLSLHEQVITLCAATHKLFVDLPLGKVKEFQLDMLAYIDNTYPHIGQEIESDRVLTDELVEKIVAAASEYKEKNR